MASPVPIGAVVKENGDVVIPATQRPDGTWRKERRLRAGYVPQDEVQAYESKGTQHQKFMANRLPPGMAPDSAEEAKPLTAAQKKNQARAAARKAKKAAERAAASASDGGVDAREVGVGEAAAALENVKVSVGGGGNEAGPGEEGSGSADAAKKVKALNKKIRQVEDLEAKVAAGEVVPSEEQRQKLARKPALLAELAEVK
ncbi:unnamed protein product, partial [Ascophyllum nodosum]